MLPAPNVSMTTPRSFSVMMDSKSENWMPGKTLMTPMGTFSSVCRQNGPSGAGSRAEASKRMEMPACASAG